MIDCSKCPERGSCCGPVPFTKELLEKHRDKIKVEIEKEFEQDKGIWIIPKDGLACVFLDRQTRKCLIYEDRPEVCRIFGEEILPCPYFKRSGNSRSKASMKKVNKLFDNRIKRMEVKYERTNKE
jgi:Fe-S-cluster containining protein